MLIQATIEDYHKACGKLFLRLNKCHSLLHKPQRCGGGLANSIFGPIIHKSFQCQNNRPEDCFSDS